MKIWVTRHGQTELNRNKRMQGLTDAPLNETGLQQARKAAEALKGIHFDAVYASPLDRAIRTAEILAHTERDRIITDPRILEVDFGKYEQKSYYGLGPAMTMYWAFPEIFPAPETVEKIPDMVKRSTSFLKELEQAEYENVLVVCHGGIIRAICGYLEDRPNGIKWRPKPHNCEIRIYESLNGQHRLIRTITAKKMNEKHFCC